MYGESTDVLSSDVVSVQMLPCSTETPSWFETKRVENEPILDTWKITFGGKRVGFHDSAFLRVGQRCCPVLACPGLLLTLLAMACLDYDN